MNLFSFFNMMFIVHRAKSILVACMITLLFFDSLMQTLGIEHAFSSFIWLCGPITGLVVGDDYNVIFKD